MSDKTQPYLPTRYDRLSPRQFLYREQPTPKKGPDKPVADDNIGWVGSAAGYA